MTAAETKFKDRAQLAREKKYKRQLHKEQAKVKVVVTTPKKKTISASNRAPSSPKTRSPVRVNATRMDCHPCRNVTYLAL